MKNFIVKNVFGIVKSVVPDLRRPLIVIRGNLELHIPVEAQTKTGFLKKNVIKLLSKPMTRENITELQKYGIEAFIVPAKEKGGTI